MDNGTNEYNGDSNQPLKISFCTTCKGRAHHLMQTLPKNLKRCQNDPNVEFVVLDYDSRDGLGEWIKDNFQREMETGRLRYVKIEDQPHFRMAHAKNVAHLAATGDIVCNLDADNYLSGSTSWLRKQLREDPDGVIHPNSREMVMLNLGRKLHLRDSIPYGACGQIAMRRDNFIALGGYNEKVSGWGPDDAEFTHRAKQHGLHYIEPPIYQINKPITHTHEERLRELSPEARKKSEALLQGPRKSRIARYAERLGNMVGVESHAKLPSFEQASFGEGEVSINFGEEKLHLGEVYNPDALRKIRHEHSRHRAYYAHHHDGGGTGRS